MNVDGKPAVARVMSDGKTAVEALHRLFSSYACTEGYEAIEVMQADGNKPLVFVPDETSYATRFIQLPAPRC